MEEKGTERENGEFWLTGNKSGEERDRLEINKRKIVLSEGVRNENVELLKRDRCMGRLYVKTRKVEWNKYTRCVRKVSDLRSYLHVGAILRHPDRGILRSSPYVIEPHAPNGASIS